MSVACAINAGRLVDGLGAVAGFDGDAAWNADGLRLAYADASLRQLRQLAGYRRLGSGVWRAGAAKADLVAALRGENVDFSVRGADPVPAAAPAVPPPASKPAAGNDDIVHKDIDVVLAALAERVPVWLVGPAGSGKSSLAKNVAKRLGVRFWSKSVSAQSSESSLMGFIDANGNCVRSPLREAFEHGGVFLLDEVDAGSSAVMVVLNSLVANGWASFPDGMVEAHPDFRIVAGANCFGSGSDRQYVGRQQQDAALLDRFAFVEMGYDSRIERLAMGLPPGRKEKSAYEVGAPPSAAEWEVLAERWYAKVVKVRDAVGRQQVRHVVSPRASIMGAALLRRGVSWSAVEKMLLRKGLADDVWARVSA